MKKQTTLHWGVAEVILAVVGVCFLLIPWFPASTIQMRLWDTAMLIMIYMILALGLNVVVGWTGLLDLGYVAFVLIGVYTTALVYSSPLAQFPFGFFIIILIAGLHCVVWGMIRGIPTLRLSGDYYTIVTFAFAEIIFTVIRNEVWLTGGPQGFRDYPSPQIWWYVWKYTDVVTGAAIAINWWFGFPAEVLKIPTVIGERAVQSSDVVTSVGWGRSTMYPDSAGYFYMTFLALVICVVVMVRLYNSRVGRAWLSINADETAARSCGIHVNRYKMLAFGVSAFCGGVGGALMVWRDRIASPSTYDFWLSVIVLCCVVLGGMGSIRGVLMGALILSGLGEVLRDLLDWMKADLGIGWADQRLRFLFYGIIMVVIMIFRPQGLFPPAKRREKFEPSDIPEMIREDSPLFGLKEEGKQ